MSEPWSYWVREEKNDIVCGMRSRHTDFDRKRPPEFLSRRSFALFVSLSDLTALHSLQLRGEQVVQVTVGLAGLAFLFSC
jgi:hypothetical protein